MGLLKKYRHQKNLTACAIEFMKMVGGRIEPPIEPVGQSAFQLSALKLSPRANLPAPRQQIMVTVNEMDRMDCLYRRNALGQIYKSAPTILWNTFSTALS